MKKLILHSLFILFFCFLGPLCAQQDKEESDQGMELIRVGTTSVMVPKDSKMRKERGMTVLESADEYVARSIKEMDERLRVFDERINEIEAQVQQLNKALEEIKAVIYTQSTVEETPENFPD